MGMYRTLFYAGLILAIAFLIASIVLFFVLKIPKAIGVVTGRTQKRAIEEIRAGGYEARSKKDAIHSSTKRIHVREVEMDTGALHHGNTGQVTKDKQEPVNLTGSTARESTSRPNRDRSKAYEQTEVLDFTGDLSEQTGAPETDETEILGGGGNAAVGEEETDVLGSGSHAEAEPSGRGRSKASSFAEEETDVLGSGRVSSGADELETDVLLSGRTSVPEDEEILGRYSAEETAVLRSMHVTEEDKARDEEKQGEIRVLYAETIVHTDEALQ